MSSTSWESDLENLQEERIKLKTEVETQRKVCSGMEQQMDTIRTEVSLKKSLPLRENTEKPFNHGLIPSLSSCSVDPAES